MKKIVNWLKKNWNCESNLDGMFRVENEFIKANEVAAEENLRKLGWNILSTDTRIAFFGYRIQKENMIHDISLREALKMN